MNPMAETMTRAACTEPRCLGRDGSTSAIDMHATAPPPRLNLSSPKLLPGGTGRPWESPVKAAASVEGRECRCHQCGGVQTGGRGLSTRKSDREGQAEGAASREAGPAQRGGHRPMRRARGSPGRPPAIAVQGQIARFKSPLLHLLGTRTTANLSTSLCLCFPLC